MFFSPQFHIIYESERESIQSIYGAVDGNRTHYLHFRTIPLLKGILQSGALPIELQQRWFIDVFESSRLHALIYQKIL